MLTKLKFLVIVEKNNTEILTKYDHIPNYIKIGTPIHCADNRQTTITLLESVDLKSYIPIFSILSIFDKVNTMSSFNFLV